MRVHLHRSVWNTGGILLPFFFFFPFRWVLLGSLHTSQARLKLDSDLLTLIYDLPFAGRHPGLCPFVSVVARLTIIRHLSTSSLILRSLGFVFSQLNPSIHETPLTSPA